MAMKAEQFLADHALQNYRPSVISNHTQTWIDGQRGWFTWRDIEAMRRDPDIGFGILVWHGPMGKVTWTVESSTPGVQDYVNSQLLRFWQLDRQKALRVLEYANAAGMLQWKMEAGLICYDAMLEFHVADCIPLLPKNRPDECIGLRINGRDIYQPQAYWIADRPEFGSVYGSRPRLAGAYQPWREANGRHGAKDVRRLWYLKNAFRGATIWHPMGNVQLEDGLTMSYQDYAREVVEKGETGGVYAFPNTRDANGNKLWEKEDPKSNGDIAGVRDYVKDLSEEKWIGMGIPPEVIKASVTGAWAGRTIPFLVYLSSLDGVIDAAIHGFDRCGLRHAVAFNFGDSAEYTIKINSLTMLAEEDKQQSPARESGHPEGMPGGYDFSTARPVQINGPMRTQVIKAAQKKYPVLLGWNAYVGQRGRRKGQPGWKNQETGRIVYGNRPEERKAISQDDMQSRLKEVYSRAPSPEQAQQLVQQLTDMKVADIKALAKSFGIRAGGPKAERARKVVEAIGKRITASEQLRRDVRAAGGNREDARQISLQAQYYRKVDNGLIDEVNRCIGQTRELVTKYSGKRFTAKHPFFDDGDFTSIPRYDEIASQVCTEFKSLFPADAQGSSGDDRELIEKLFDMVKGGKVMRTNLESTRKQAFDEWLEQRKLKSDETVPFSLNAG